MAKSGKSDKCEFLERIWKMQESDYSVVAYFYKGWKWCSMRSMF